MSSTAERVNPLLYLFGKTWHYSLGNRRNVVAYWIMFVCSELLNSLMGPLLWAKMIEVLTNQGINQESMRTLRVLLLLVMVRVLASWAFHGPARCIERANAFQARVSYCRHLLRGVLALPMEWHVEHHTGDTIDKISKGANALYNFAENAYLPIKSLVQLLICLAALSYFSPAGGVVVLSLILFSAWITIRFDKVLVPQYDELNENENQVSESVVDTITNISTIIVLRVEKLVFETIMRRFEKPFDLFKRNQRIGEVKWFLTSLCANLMTVLTLLIYFYQKWDSTPGAVVAGFYLLSNYLDRIGDLFYQFTSMYSDIVRQKSGVMNAEKLSREFRSENLTNHVLPPSWRELDVRDLSFSYHKDGEDLHLEKVNLKIHRGETVALVGKTGSGKSTALKIFRGVYQPQKGELLVDGRGIDEGFNGISRAITLVQQNPEILAWSILRNITMGAEHDLAFVQKFTDMACFTSVVEGLPKKFESSIKEKGVNLSGGQQQRLALSRGLLACHDKDIVLLDEPTSSLDAFTELTVYKNIFREFKGKTIISTVHKLSLLPLFDRIYVFDSGRVVGSGTIQELLQTCPEFIKLWSAMEDTTAQ
jgi:ATP-binding cassette, subfamily B, bacterial